MRWTGVILLAGALAVAAPAAAHPLQLAVAVVSGQKEARAVADQSPPIGGTVKRPVIRARVDEPIEIRWFIKNTDRHAALKQIIVHFFVAREEQVGQANPPDPRRGAEAESAFAMDFPAGRSRSGKLNFAISEPGSYLVRLETLNSNGDHEHFAAIDLQVE